MADTTSPGATRRFRLSAQAGVVGAWAALILVGMVGLRLPMSASGASLSWIDAAFTATSAVCVTGLSTITVHENLSFPGQVLLLILIQLGGLGIGTVSTFLLLSAGRAGVADHFEAQESLASMRMRPFRLVRWAVFITIVAEGLGALLLKTRFTGEDAWWNAIFHSVSAFCNAGFSLFSGNLAPHQQDGLVNAVLASLIILGGLGFIIHVELLDRLLRRSRKRAAGLSLHARVVLIGNVVLWLGGAVMFLSLEHGNALADLGPQKIMAGMFQSVSMRTAGFSTVDFGTLREVTLVFCMLLMLIGAAPGSVGGGLKVTTAAVLVAVAYARLKSSHVVTLLNRTLPDEAVMRAFAVTTLSLLLIAAVTLGLLVTESNPALTARSHDRLTSMAFETVSAFGTVGLSTGITPSLTVPGKLMLIAAMFVGRLGPLAVGLAVLGAVRKPLYRHPTETLAIG